MNICVMIELKKEYMSQLNHILAPVILEGLQSLYDDAKKISKSKEDKNNVLKNFQSLLKRIPIWESSLITAELTRISSKLKTYDWYVKLIQTIFQMNYVIYDMELSEENKKEVNLSNFIHNIYIECAREFWMDPFLFYHEYSACEQKKNYLEIIKKIHCAIEMTFRLMLPMNMILTKFLDNYKSNIKSAEYTNIYDMPLLLEKIPIEKQKEQVGGMATPDQLIPQFNPLMNPQMIPQMMPQQMIPQQIIPQMLPQQIIAPNPVQESGFIPVSNKIVPEQQNIQTGGDENINDKILNIINKNNLLTESNDNNHFTVNNHSAVNAPMMTGGVVPQQINPIVVPVVLQQPTQQTDKRSSSTLKRIIHESINQSHHTASRSNSASEIKNKLLKELDTESHAYAAEENADNYQDVFSNSEAKNTVNTNEKIEKKSREKFFSNYLNI